MNEQHTPGPWNAGEKAMQGSGKRDWYAVQHIFNQEPFEGVLENEWGVYPPPGHAGPVCIAQGEENARLIASAPDLLAACQALIEYQRKIDADESSGLFGAYLNAVEGAAAAIDKATGGAA